MKNFNFNLKSLSLNSLKSLSLPFTLQRREKIVLTATGIVLGVFVVMQLLIFPVINKRTHLHAQINSKIKALQEIQTLKAEYEALTRNVRNNEAQLKQRPKGFTLFSFLDNLAGKSGLKQNIIYMKPSTSNLKNSPYVVSMVEMKLQSLTMEQLVAFLHGVETSPQMVWIKRMSISRGEKEESLISSVLQVETFQL